ncbi:MAG: oligosaccharide flippase family protein [Rhizobacter sp.]|nr:oligosaccharide flippase family protein [Rhizobacter sp.]
MGFLLVPIYTRLLDPLAYGAFDLIITAGLLVTLVVALEVGQGLAREWADHPAQRRQLASTALAFTVLSHAAFLAVALAASASLTQLLLGAPDFEAELRAGLVFIAANAVFLQLQSQFRWDMRPRAYAAVSLTYGVLTLALGAGLGYSCGLRGVLWGQAIAAGLCVCMSLTMLRGQIGFGLSWPQLGRMLRFSLPLVASGVALLVGQYVNRPMLAELASLEDVGIFGVGQRIAGLTLLLIVGLQGALTPLVYRHHREPGVPAQLARLFEGFVAVAMICCLFLTVFARELVALIAAPEFVAAAALVPWLAPAALLSQMYIFAPGIAIARKTHWQLVLTCLVAALAVYLNLQLIPRLGAVGAAVANCLAAAAFLLMWVAASQRVYALPLRGPALGLAALAYVALAALGRWVDHGVGSSGIGIVAKLIVLASLAGALGALGLVPRRWKPAPRAASAAGEPDAAS